MWCVLFFSRAEKKKRDIISMVLTQRQFSSRALLKKSRHVSRLAHVKRASSTRLLDLPARGSKDDFRWAHVTWTFLHEMSFYIDMHENDSPKAQASFHNVVTALVLFLPCTWCRKHLDAHIATNPLPTPRVYAADKFPNARWLVDLHNAVNTRQHKGVVEFESVRAHYVDGAAQPACPSIGMVDDETTSTGERATTTAAATTATATTATATTTTAAADEQDGAHFGASASAASTGQSGEQSGEQSSTPSSAHSSSTSTSSDQKNASGDRGITVVDGYIIAVAVVIVFFVLVALILQIVSLTKKATP